MKTHYGRMIEAEAEVERLQARIAELEAQTAPDWESVYFATVEASRAEACFVQGDLAATLNNLMRRESRGKPVAYKHQHFGQFIGVTRYQQLDAERKANYLPLYLRAPQAVPEVSLRDSLLKLAEEFEQIADDDGPEHSWGPRACAYANAAEKARELLAAAPSLEGEKG